MKKTVVKVALWAILWATVAGCSGTPSPTASNTQGKPPTASQKTDGIPKPVEATEAGEMQKLQGSWKLVGVTLSGIEFNPETLKQEGAGLVITNNVYSLTGNAATNKGTLKLDPAHAPKFLDFTATEGPLSGQTELGIYKLEGKQLIINRKPANKGRPTSFEAKGDKDALLTIYER